MLLYQYARKKSCPITYPGYEVPRLKKCTAILNRHNLGYRHLYTHAKGKGHPPQSTNVLDFNNYAQYPSSAMRPAPVIMSAKAYKVRLTGPFCMYGLNMNSCAISSTRPV